MPTRLAVGLGPGMTARVSLGCNAPLASRRRDSVSNWARSARRPVLEHIRARLDDQRQGGLLGSVQRNLPSGDDGGCCRLPFADLWFWSRSGERWNARDLRISSDRSATSRSIVTLASMSGRPSGPAIVACCRPSPTWARAECRQCRKVSSNSSDRRWRQLTLSLRPLTDRPSDRKMWRPSPRRQRGTFYRRKLRRTGEFV